MLRHAPVDAITWHDWKVHLRHQKPEHRNLQSHEPHSLHFLESHDPRELSLHTTLPRHPLQKGNKLEAEEHRSMACVSSCLVLVSVLAHYVQHLHHRLKLPQENQSHQLVSIVNWRSGTSRFTCKSLVSLPLSRGCHSRSCRSK